jgi:hypothetical protein
MRSKFRVRLTRFNCLVEFSLLAQTQTFAITTDDDATPFDNPVDAEEAIAACPSIKQFSPVIEPYEDSTIPV